ncbi:MAG: hypothetical protein NTZ78_14780 [Candidatus Aureabacteria bacterium]|nr:hypothetical protein [Candidatus Auribacterota bacterium]
MRPSMYAAILAASLIAIPLFLCGCASGIAPRIPAMKYGTGAPYGSELPSSQERGIPLKEAPEELPSSFVK